MRNPFRAAPGRHTAAWAQLLQDRAELRREVRDSEQKCEAMRAERDAAWDEIEQLRQRQHRMETGYSDALKTMGAESMGIAKKLEQAKAEVQRLNRVLDDSKNLPGTSPYVAPKDDPESCFSQPSPPPMPNTMRIVPPEPVAPVDSEAADVCAETQPTDVRHLLDGWIPAQWTATVMPMLPRLPDPAPTLTMPLAEAPMATEVSRDAADAARASVAERLEPDPADAMAAP